MSVKFFANVLTKCPDIFRCKRPAHFYCRRATAFFCLGLFVFSGCGTASYRRSTDRAAYKLVRHTQETQLGETNSFSIDTKYTGRKPEEISPADLIDDRMETNLHAMSIEDAINLAVDHSREYQSAKEDLYRAALNVSSVRYAVGRSIAATSVTAADWARDSGGHHTKAVTVENGVTFSQLFQTGGRLTVSALNSIMFYYSGRPELSFSQISGSLVQPLLRGFGGNNPDVERLTQAERNLVYAARDFSFFQDQFALGIVNDYFALLQQKDTIRNRYTNYLGRVQATKRLEARAVDRERLSDVDQARQAELSARNNYVDAIARYRTSLDQFKITLGLPVGDRLYLDDHALDELQQTGLIPAQLDPHTAFDLAVHRQLQSLNYIDEFEDAKRHARITADKLKPGLNLIAAGELDSIGDTDYTRFNGNRAIASAGLQLDLPLDRIPRGNAYRGAIIDFEASLRTFTARLDSIKAGIENSLRTLRQRRENYEIQQNALMLANRRVLSATLLLEAGRSEVRNLIEAQDAQISSQTAVTAALIAYQEARLQLMLNIGALDTDVPDFWLKDQLASYVPQRTATDETGTANRPVPLPEESFRN